MRVKPDAPESAAERLFVIGGSAIAIAGILKRSTTGGLGLMLLGGALVGKGLQVRQHNIELAHGCVEPTLPRTSGHVIEHFVVIDRPVGQVYGYWRNLENLPRFMPHLESVKEIGEGKSTWTAKGPKGSLVSWEAEIIADVQFEVIAWRTLPGAALRNEGAVYFHELPNDRTEVHLYMEIHPPLGEIGLRVASWIGENPEAEVRADLERFKAVMEGSNPSSAGFQPVQSQP
jgi:uncharacterized membrane protein